MGPTIVIGMVLCATAFAAGVAVGRRRAAPAGTLGLVLEQAHARGNAELDGRTTLIDRQLAAMTDELRRVGALVHDLDADRRESFGALAGELRRQHEGLSALNETTRQLREALASTKSRGQW